MLIRKKYAHVVTNTGPYLIHHNDNSQDGRVTYCTYSYIQTAHCFWNVRAWLIKLLHSYMLHCISVHLSYTCILHWIFKTVDYYVFSYIIVDILRGYYSDTRIEWIHSSLKPVGIIMRILSCTLRREIETSIKL